jgi:hypothetical protein
VKIVIRYAMAWITFLSVQAASGALFIGLMVVTLAPGLAIIGAQKALGWSHARDSAVAPADIKVLQDRADDAQAAFDSSVEHLKAEILTDNSPEAITNIRASLQTYLKLLNAAVETQDNADEAKAEADAAREAKEDADAAAADHDSQRYN